MKVSEVATGSPSTLAALREVLGLSNLDHYVAQVQFSAAQMSERSGNLLISLNGIGAQLAAAEGSAALAGEHAADAADHSGLAQTAATQAQQVLSGMQTGIQSVSDAANAAVASATNAANSAAAAASSSISAATAATAAAGSAVAADGSAAAATVSATAAAASAATATTQAGNASASASTAATHAGNASTSAGAAATSASAASGSAGAAASSATAAGASASAATISASTAESAAGPTYASIALGEAATTTGQSFAVDNGDGTVSVYLRTGDGSTLQRTLATTAALAAHTGAALVGFKQAGAGAVARTLQEKAREHVSLADFGPVGTENDTATFQLAVNRAAERGAILYVPDGEYFVAGSVNTMPFPHYGGIRIPSNSHIRMAPRAVIRVIPNALSKYMVFSCYDAENVTIEGGQIIGDRTAHTYPNLFSTLAGLNANNYRTKDNYAPDPATWADGKIAYVYQDTAANNGTYTRTSGAWVRTSPTYPSYLTHEFGNAFEILNSRNVSVHNVKISDMTGDGMLIGVTNQGPVGNKKTSGVHVSGCVFDACRRQGISVVDGDNVTITGNLFRDIGIRKNMQDGAAPRSGIDIESGGLNKTSGVTVTGNIFTNCVGASVIQYDGNNVTISGNVADTSMSYGFGVNTSIVGNTITKGGIAGNSFRIPISFTYTQSGSTMTVTTATPHGLYTGGLEYFSFFNADGMVAHSGAFIVTVVNATTLTFDTPGFTSASGSGAQKYLNNNVVIANNNLIDGGISVVGKGMVVSQNSIVNGTIQVFGAAEDCSISGNFVAARPTVDGIRVFQGCARIQVVGNYISGSGISGIRSGGTDSLIEGNSIYKSFGGVIVDAGNANVQGNTIDLGGWPGTTTSSVGINVGGSAAHSVVSENLVLNARHNAILCVRPATIANNKVMRHAGSHAIFLSTAGAVGSRVIGNIVESNLSASGTAMAVAVTGNTDARVIGNTIYSINAPWFRAIDTSGSTSSRITNNVHSGSIYSHASDTLTGNVAY